MTVDIFLYLLLSYLLGSIPVGFILYYIVKREDIRNTGSGNIGATNVFRNQGKLSGIFTLLTDLLKGVLPIVYGILNFKESPFIIIVAGSLAVFGHIFPIFLKFKGGKGVATFAGVFLVYSTMSAPFFILVFLITIYYTRYVSLASVFSVITVFFYILFTHTVYISIVVFVISCIVIFKHRYNFIRIGEGKEPKIMEL